MLLVHVDVNDGAGQGSRQEGPAWWVGGWVDCLTQGQARRGWPAGCSAVNQALVLTALVPMVSYRDLRFDPIKCALKPGCAS